MINSKGTKTSVEGVFMINEKEFSPQVLESAKVAAKDMLAKNETFRKIKFGNESGTFYLTTDKGLLINDGEFEVDGVTFHIGMLMKLKG